MSAIHSHSSWLGQQLGSMCACVQETKTLHALHKQNMLRYTCVFPNIWQLTSHKTQPPLCKWQDNPIQSQLQALIRLMTWDVVTWSPSSELHTSAWPNASSKGTVFAKAKWSETQSHKQLFRPYWGSSVWRPKVSKTMWDYLYIIFQFLKFSLKRDV